MAKPKVILNNRRHDFLLTLFPDKEEKFKAIELNGYILVRQWNGGTKRWEVAIHTTETYRQLTFVLKAKQPLID